MSVAIIIVNYNSGALLCRCLKSLSDQTLCADELVVVDNASTDAESQSMLASITTATVIKSETNLGYGGAINLAVQKIDTTDYIVCLNPDAFPEPYVLDARKCISYLTIESKEAIPLALRPLMGNRVFGCDDCQIICPWNRFASQSKEDDFTPRHNLDNPDLVTLFNWEPNEFLEKTRGSPIRRIGHERWLRNLAVGLGNATGSEEILNELQAKSDHPSALVREHVQWAIDQQQQKLNFE